MRMRKVLGTLLICLVFALAGCGGGGSDSSPAPASSNKVSLSSKEVYLPDGISTLGSPTGDFTGAVVTAGSANEVAGFVAEKPDLGTTTPAPSFAVKILNNDTDELGEDTNNKSVSSLASTSGTSSADAILTTAISAISSLTYVDTISNIFKSTNQNPDTVLTQYTVTLSSGMTSIALSNDILQLIGLNKNGGAVSNLPSVSGATTSTSYRLSLTVQYYDASTVIIIVSLVPEANYSTYATVIASLGDGSNIVNTAATLTSKTDPFTAQGGGGMADFLFVIDNSGSMSDEQTAVSEAATIFGAAVSRLDYMIGVITTDSDVLSTKTSNDNKCSTCASSDPFTNDLTEFSYRVKQGTSGSGTETGIYWAERALLTSSETTSYGYSANGTVTQAGYPRSGASLSVIILSDEEDQYKSKSGNVPFDISNNIFVSKGYRVYSIVDSNDASTSQYDELSYQTGGMTSDINDITTFTKIMDTIASNAGGAASLFVLTETPLSGTISVTVNGTTMVNSTTNGWQYIASSNSIVFYGTAIPQQGASVSVSYQYVQ